jgi:hypothetical protein
MLESQRPNRFPQIDQPGIGHDEQGIRIAFGDTVKYGVEFARRLGFERVDCRPESRRMTSTSRGVDGLAGLPRMAITRARGIISRK